MLSSPVQSSPGAQPRQTCLPDLSSPRLSSALIALGYHTSHKTTKKSLKTNKKNPRSPRIN